MLVIVFLGFVAVALSHGVNDFTRVFDFFDGNDDGIIQLNELFAGYNNDDKNMMHAIRDPYTPGRLVVQRLKLLSHDKDGLITPEEFAAGSHPGSPPLDMVEAFQVLDELDRLDDELLDPTAVLDPLKRMDKNNDRKITREEFDKNFVQLFLGTEDDDIEVQA